jgi:hypothetical protein
MHTDSVQRWTSGSCGSGGRKTRPASGK